MKNAAQLTWLCGALWLATCTGCQTTAPRAEHRAKFQESASADVILRFNRWDTIHMLRPETRDAGFLPILTREDVERELKNRRVGKNLAVVVLGFLFPPDVEAQYAREWDAFLSAQGFQRVVILRTGMGRTTDGLLVVHDSGIGGFRDPATVANIKAAPLPPATGADAPNPSGR